LAVAWVSLKKGLIGVCMGECRNTKFTDEGQKLRCTELPSNDCDEANNTIYV